MTSGSEISLFGFKYKNKNKSDIFLFLHENMSVLNRILNKVLHVVIMTEIYVLMKKKYRILLPLYGLLLFIPSRIHSSR